MTNIALAEIKELLKQQVKDQLHLHTCHIVDQLIAFIVRLICA